MEKEHTVDSREIGLVLGKLLLNVEDLHYGLWEEDIPLSLDNLAKAQQRYTDRLIEALPAVDGHPEGRPVRILDVGCGTGNLLVQLRSMGYHADGVVPSPSLARLVEKRLAELPNQDAKLFCTTFEEMETEPLAGHYDVVLFSESFQYIDMQASMSQAKRLMAPEGRVLICDFFKTAAAGDGEPGDKVIGGGHSLSSFYRMVEEVKFSMLRDDDITHLVSPNMDLVDTLLMQKVKPSSEIIWAWLRGNYPWSARLLGFVMRKKARKIQRKYFSGLRTGETFAKYKNYRFIIMQPAD